MKPTLFFGLAFLSQETLFLKARADDCTKDNVDAWIGGESLECPTSWVGFCYMPPPPICDFRDSEIPEFPKFESSPHRFRWGNGCHFPLFHRCEYPEKIMMLGRRSGFLLGRPAYFQGNHHCCRTEATKANHSRLPSQSPNPRWNLHPPTNNQHLKSLQHFGKKKNSRSWQKLPEMCKESI